ncbi:hypothetical protein OE749_16855 [Aestuariibacter sp. AA17]|uniref:FlgD/Vpr Ig-like domain-containing protein n=1 Tax=Fluctibacter corallii TaxID=2984329 RepID=A0ABT3ACQ9_9ALTE|nr:FlgD immunoglobulin-like domain containing protein [Aestuariibacter sp. AA17]MCV2886367.1 hypothetical protein [Aestuariibacter sp. AA17]
MELNKWCRGIIALLVCVASGMSVSVAEETLVSDLTLSSVLLDTSTLNSVKSTAKASGATLTMTVKAPLSTLRVTFYSGDNDDIKTVTMKNVQPGIQSLNWNGRDNAGDVVPDEAYTAVITAISEDGVEQVIDSRNHSGGELLEQVNTRILNNSTVAYTLAQPARVMVRMGLQGGPLMNTILSWEPRMAGENRQAWNGYDKSNVMHLATHQDLRVLVMAYTLPEYTVITHGNPDLSYTAYRSKKGWPAEKIRPESMISQRNGKRISPYYFLPRSAAYEPEILFSIKSDVNKNNNGDVIADSPLLVSVNLNDEDKWLMQQSQYEISFFVDGKFVAEEETGYTPLTWQWDPRHLTPGRHLFTVNISGLWGHVGVYNMFVTVPNNQESTSESATKVVAGNGPKQER